ncbi:magnesium transporter NIPA-domain-containing protein [Fomitopsis serialis]|uniref:magnesium transporter NIPA-domain-containing protein n=1 Tax=Fomitopsis serialis TaxID=139415 RepID=UPI002007492F|nr:magnesium transporter NIPA-domain-containing protein [Neoantrodia serialis]KAH9938496.1 magnesium transporter NIPA-domain-containing protein [Neoantrodia serialis]
MSSIASILYNALLGGGDGGYEIPSLPQISRGTFAGIVVAISGNVVISLALNCQKLAHKRLEEERTTKGDELQSRTASGERTPRISHDPCAHASRSHPAHANGEERRRTTSSESKTQDTGNESDYLKSKLWWFGFILMNIGELGNFISYAFAPASVVAPLGTFALIANCFFAPLMLKERFRKRDFLGILIAVVGAVTVVLSTNPSDVRLGPDALVHAITQRPFVIYAVIYIAGATILTILSERGAGKQYVYVDVGLCALFGGFTVLATKAFSTLLTLEAFEMFTQWITYPVLLVLISTGIGQIRYLNRALMRFDSKVVVPTQFVMFNISAIVGSAILYGDFARGTFHQIVTFLYGCGATFVGVFIIAWAPSTSQEPEEDEEGTIGDVPPSEVDGTVTGLSSRSGSVAHRNRVRVIAADGSSATPILRNRHSVVSMYGLSPAQV